MNEEKDPWKSNQRDLPAWERKKILKEYRAHLEKERKKWYEKQMSRPLFADEIRCSRCTIDFPSYYDYCGHCGKKLLGTDKTDMAEIIKRKRDGLEEEARELDQPMPEYIYCIECRNDFDEVLYYCPHCGNKSPEYRDQKLEYDERYQQY